MTTVFNDYLLAMAYIQIHTPKARDAKQKAERQVLYSRLEEKLNCHKAWETWSVEEKRTRAR